MYYNDRYDCTDRYNDCNQYYKQQNNNYNYNKCNFEKSCCMKRTEETYFCYPSYYNEDKHEEKDEYPCYVGTFRMCPEKSKCDTNYNKQEKYQNSNTCRNNQHGHNRCCLCSWFGRW